MATPPGCSLGGKEGGTPRGLCGPPVSIVPRGARTPRKLGEEEKEGYERLTPVRGVMARRRRKALG